MHTRRCVASELFLKSFVVVVVMIPRLNCFTVNCRFCVIDIQIAIAVYGKQYKQKKKKTIQFSVCVCERALSFCVFVSRKLKIIVCVCVYVRNMKRKQWLRRR